MEETNKGGFWGKIGAGLVVVALLGYFGYRYVKSSGSAATEPVATGKFEGGEVLPGDNTGNTYTTPYSTPAPSSTYKDGTYSATGNYISPGGEESIKVTVTLKNDVISDANVVSLATRPESKNFQSKFISGYKALVIGKDIATVELTKVSGSSLTPGGFNDALSKIKVEARA